jgi:hypothetical protein
VSRPPFCIVDRCTPVRQFDKEDGLYLAAGGSFFCAGILERGESWPAGDMVHTNPWCFCVYTPFKGWVRFLINRDDAKIITGLIRRLGEKSREVKVSDSLVRRQGKHGREAPAADTTA